MSAREHECDIKSAFFDGAELSAAFVAAVNGELIGFAEASLRYDQRRVEPSTAEQKMGRAVGLWLGRWDLHDDHVDLSPHQNSGTLIRFDAQLMPFVDDMSRGALVVIDMQNDFCAPGGWTELSVLDFQRCRSAIPGLQRAVEAAREHGMWAIGFIGQTVLTSGTWGHRRFIRLNTNLISLEYAKNLPTAPFLRKALGESRWWTN
jgi:hypothetical protein